MTNPRKNSIEEYMKQFQDNNNEELLDDPTNTQDAVALKSESSSIMSIDTISQAINNFRKINEEENGEFTEKRDNIASQEEIDQINSDLESGKLTIDDFQTLYSLNLDHDDENPLYLSIRNAEFKTDNIYLDKQTKEERLVIENEGLKAYLNKGEKLGDIIEILPYGIINKRITGIGATTLELKAKRNSIIVMPTKVLAYNKYCSLQDKDNALLCIGSGYLDLVDPIDELIIHNYIKRTDTPFKKIIVVADSLDKLIKSILKVDTNAYNHYFLMVDEIDTLQSSNRQRKRISNVIDYYFYFKVQKRALVSATINKFSHPLLKDEALTIFDYKEPERRDIILNCTKSINKAVAERIITIRKTSPEKIAIAYNSISNIQQTINLLPEELQKQCGVLCSDVSKAIVGQYYTLLDHEDKLKTQITFMTSSYFAGIDIQDKCHLISVSNVNKAFSILSLNAITQIWGRFRKGVLSDAIIYNIFKIEDESVSKWLYPDIEKYRERLLYKAQKVKETLNALSSMTLSENEDVYDVNSLSSLFDRIKYLIVENAREKIYGGETYPLLRVNIHNKIEEAHFNIDDLYNKMNTNVKLYRSIEALFNVLDRNHNIQNEFIEISSITGVKEKIKEVNQIRLEFVEERLVKAQQEIISLHKDKSLTDDRLNWLIREAETQYEAFFYERVRLFYTYINIKELTDNLLTIGFGNKKSYRNLKNALLFWVLDKNHPFKNQVLKAFKKGQKYSSAEIEEILSPIIKYHFFKIISRSRIINHFKSYFQFTYTGGKYIVKGNNPLNLSKALKKISPTEINLADHFEI